MSNIRLTYAGLISFLILMVSIFTGLIFTIIVTRRLEQADFALWSLIGGIVVYSMVFAPVSNYWVNRHIARGENEATTGIIASLILSIGGMIVFLTASFFISESSDSNFQILLFAAILIPLTYTVNSFTAISGSYKPQGNAFAMLTFELTKIPVGFFLVYVADMGIIGAISTTFIANSVMLIFYVLYLKNKIREKFHTYTFKNWLKLSWIPLLAGMHDRIIHMDTTIFTVISGSVIGVSYIGAAKAISNLVSNASSISVGLAPKLLATQKVHYIELMFDRTLLFAIPMLGFVLVFAKAGLWILNPIYVNGIFVVYLWGIIHFLYVTYGIFYSGLMGLERVDVGFNANRRKYLKSRLFSVPLVYLVGYSSYIGSLIVVFSLSKNLEIETLEILFWWGIIGIIANVGILITFWTMIKKTTSLQLPAKKISKYIILTSISVIILHFIISEYLEYKESIFDFVPSLIPYLILYVAIYFGLLLAWEKDLRILFHQVFAELKR